jgi:hypothetical protein
MSNNTTTEGLLDILSNKENISIEFNGTCNDAGLMSMRLINRVNLKQNVTYKVALVSLETGSFIPNVDSTNNKFYYSSDGGTTTEEITIPESALNISDSDATKITYYSIIKEKIKEKNHNPDNIVIQVNTTTGKTHITLKNNYRVYFTRPNTWRECLGFNSRDLITNGVHESDNTANVFITQKIYVGCNLCSGSICAGNVPSRNILFSFANSKRFGVPLIIAPNPLRPRQLTLKTFDKLDLYFFSDDGKPITFLGRQITGEISIWQV